MGAKKKASDQKSITIVMNNKPFEVPPGGSLGLLALGNIGVRAWKQAASIWKENELKESGNEEKK